MDIKLLFAFINFIILLVGLRFVLKQPARDFSRTRREIIRQEIEAVTLSRRQTEARFQEYRKRLSLLEHEIVQIRQEMQHLGHKEKEILIKQAKVYAEKIRSDATRVAEQELRRAKAQLHQLTLKEALHIAEQLVKNRVTIEDHERLFGDFMQQLSQQAESAGKSA